MKPLPRMEVFAKVTSVDAFGRAAAALGIQLPGAGAPPGLTPAQIAKAREEREDMDLSESNYDEFSGYSQDLFSGLPYDAEDKVRFCCSTYFQLVRLTVSNVL